MAAPIPTPLVPPHDVVVDTPAMMLMEAHVGVLPIQSPFWLPEKQRSAYVPFYNTSMVLFLRELRKKRRTTIPNCGATPPQSSPATTSVVAPVMPNGSTFHIPISSANTGGANTTYSTHCCAQK